MPPQWASPSTKWSSRLLLLTHADANDEGPRRRRRRSAEGAGEAAHGGPPRAGHHGITAIARVEGIGEVSGLEAHVLGERVVHVHHRDVLTCVHEGLHERR